MSKTCKNCHDLKSLKKELLTSYEQFHTLAESKGKMEDGYLSRIEELNQEIEYFKEHAKKQSDAIYRLTCQNESLTNQVTSQPGLATVNQYKEQAHDAVREQSKAWQLAAQSARKQADAEKRVKELELVIDQLKKCSYCDNKLRCDCLDE